MVEATYYSDSDISITDRQIRFGQQTFQVYNVESFDLQPGIRGAFRGFGGLLRVVTLVVGLLLLLCGSIISLWQIFSGTASNSDGYAHSWVDYLPLIGIILASISILSIGYKTKASVRITLIGKEGKLGSYNCDPAKALRVADALRQATQPDIGNGTDTDTVPGVLVYDEGGVQITTEEARLAGKSYLIGDIASAEIVRKMAPSVMNNYLLALFTVALIPSILPAFGKQLMIIDNGILLPSAWLTAAGAILLGITLVYSNLRSAQRVTNKRLYGVKIWGRFGRYNETVILPIEALYTDDEARAGRVVEAIYSAIEKRRKAGKQTLIEPQAVGTAYLAHE